MVKATILRSSIVYTIGSTACANGPSTLIGKADFDCTEDNFIVADLYFDWMNGIGTMQKWNQKHGTRDCCFITALHITAILQR